MKFRIFDIKENRYLNSFDYAINGDSEIFLLRSGREEDGYFTGYEDNFNIIIEEAIEDKDKNDKEIYVGDLVKAKSLRTLCYQTYTIKHLKGYLGFVLGKIAIPEHDLTDKEVVGNIHTRIQPELSDLAMFVKDCFT